MMTENCPLCICTELVLETALSSLSSHYYCSICTATCMYINTRITNNDNMQLESFSDVYTSLAGTIDCFNRIYFDCSTSSYIIEQCQEQNTAKSEPYQDYYWLCHHSHQCWDISLNLLDGRLAKPIKGFYQTYKWYLTTVFHQVCFTSGFTCIVNMKHVIGRPHIIHRNTSYIAV